MECLWKDFKCGTVSPSDVGAGEGDGEKLIDICGTDQVIFWGTHGQACDHLMLRSSGIRAIRILWDLDEIKTVNLDWASVIHNSLYHYLVPGWIIDIRMLHLPDTISYLYFSHFLEEIFVTSLFKDKDRPSTTGTQKSFWWRNNGCYLRRSTRRRRICLWFSTPSSSKKKWNRKLVSLALSLTLYVMILIIRI